MVMSTFSSVDTSATVEDIPAIVVEVSLVALSVLWAAKGTAVVVCSCPVVDVSLVVVIDVSGTVVDASVVDRLTVWGEDLSVCAPVTVEDVSVTFVDVPVVGLSVRTTVEATKVVDSSCLSVEAPVIVEDVANIAVKASVLGVSLLLAEGGTKVLLLS